MGKADIAYLRHLHKSLFHNPQYEYGILNEKLKPNSCKLHIVQYHYSQNYPNHNLISQKHICLFELWTKILLDIVRKTLFHYLHMNLCRKVYCFKGKLYSEDLTTYLCMIHIAELNYQQFCLFHKQKDEKHTYNGLSKPKNWYCIFHNFLSYYWQYSHPHNQKHQ